MVSPSLEDTKELALLIGDTDYKNKSVKSMSASELLNWAEGFELRLT